LQSWFVAVWTAQMPNQVTAPNASELRHFPIRALWVARVGEF